MTYIIDFQQVLWLCIILVTTSFEQIVQHVD